MDNSKRQTDESFQWYDEQTVPTEPDQMWDLLPPSNTGTPNPQEQTYESPQGYPEQTVWTQRAVPFSAEAPSNQLAHDAWTSAVWVIHTQHLPEARSASEQHPDQGSFGTRYPANDANQDEYHANTFQTGSVATGVNPAHMPRDYGLGPDYGQPLSISNAAPYDPQAVGPEFHGTSEPSGSIRSESNEQSGPRAQQSQRKRSKNLPRFLVKRQDGGWFNHNGKLVDTTEVYGLTALAAVCSCSNDKVKEAVANIGSGEAASVTTKSGTWVIRSVAS